MSRSGRDTLPGLRPITRLVGGPPPVYGSGGTRPRRTPLFWLYAALVLVTGGLLALQPVINADVARRIAHPMSAALISVTVTFLALFLATVALRAPLPTPRLVGVLPPWMLGAGLIGAIFLFVSAVNFLWMAPVLLFL